MSFYYLIINDIYSGQLYCDEIKTRELDIPNKYNFFEVAGFIDGKRIYKLECTDAELKGNDVIITKKY